MKIEYFRCARCDTSVPHFPESGGLCGICFHEVSPPRGRRNREKGAGPRPARARPSAPSDASEWRSYDRGKRDGEQAGYDRGKRDGEQAGYDRGGREGYAKGRADGYETGLRRAVEDGEAGRRRAFEDGYQAGRADRSVGPTESLSLADMNWLLRLAHPDVHQRDKERAHRVACWLNDLRSAQCTG